VEAALASIPASTAPYIAYGWAERRSAAIMRGYRSAR
jgi:hypothetical protein